MACHPAFPEKDKQTKNGFYLPVMILILGQIKRFGSTCHGFAAICGLFSLREGPDGKTWSREHATTKENKRSVKQVLNGQASLACWDL